MEFKELGQTGVKVPEIALGTWQYSGGVEPLRTGISQGALLLDTAEMYKNEAIAGEAVKDQRDRVLIATKVSGNHLRYDEVMRAAEESLKRLGTGVIDLYQIHWPDPAVPLKETMRAMETLVDRGLVRFIGVSNFYLKNLEEAQAALSHHGIVSNQVKYSLLDREIEEEILPYCQKNRITVMAYSPLARGALASKPLLKNRQAMGALQRIAREGGKTMAQVALNWCVSKPNVIAITKSNRVERVIEACSASRWRLTPEQLNSLDKAFRQ